MLPKFAIGQAGCEIVFELLRTALGLTRRRSAAYQSVGCGRLVGMLTVSGRQTSLKPGKPQTAAFVYTGLR